MVDHLAALKVRLDDDGTVRRRSSIQLNPPSESELLELKALRDEACRHTEHAPSEADDRSSVDSGVGSGDGREEQSDSRSSRSSSSSSNSSSSNNNNSNNSNRSTTATPEEHSLLVALICGVACLCFAMAQRACPPLVKRAAPSLTGAAALRRRLASSLEAPMVITTATQTAAHIMGFTAVLLCLAAIGLLVIYRDEDMLAKVKREHPTVPTLHATMAVAFLFSVALNWLSATHAMSLERRTLSTVLTYVSAVACMVYSAMAFLPLLAGMSHSGHPVYILRYTEWLLTCPAMLYFAALTARQKMREGLSNLLCDIVVVTCGLLGQFLPPKLSVAAGVVATLSYVALMSTLFNSFGRGALWDGSFAGE